MYSQKTEHCADIHIHQVLDTAWYDHVVPLGEYLANNETDQRLPSRTHKAEEIRHGFPVGLKKKKKKTKKKNPEEEEMFAASEPRRDEEQGDGAGLS